MLMFCSIYLVCNTDFQEEALSRKISCFVFINATVISGYFLQKLKDFTFWSCTYFAVSKWVSIHDRMKVRERCWQCSVWRMSSILQNCCHEWWMHGQCLTDLMDVENKWFFLFSQREEQKLIAEAVERSLVVLGYNTGWYLWYL